MQCHSEIAREILSLCVPGVQCAFAALAKLHKVAFGLCFGELVHTLFAVSA